MYGKSMSRHVNKKIKEEYRDNRREEKKELRLWKVVRRETLVLLLGPQESF